MALHRLESASDWVRNVDRFMIREIGLVTGNCIPRWWECSGIIPVSPWAIYKEAAGHIWFSLLLFVFVCFSAQNLHTVLTIPRHLSVNSPAPELTARVKVRAKVKDRDRVRVRVKVRVSDNRPWNVWLIPLWPVNRLWGSPLENTSKRHIYTWFWLNFYQTTFHDVLIISLSQTNCNVT